MSGQIGGLGGRDKVREEVRENSREGGGWVAGEAYLPELERAVRDRNGSSRPSGASGHDRLPSGTDAHNVPTAHELETPILTTVRLQHLHTDLESPQNLTRQLTQRRSLTSGEPSQLITSQTPNVFLRTTSAHPKGTKNETKTNGCGWWKGAAPPRVPSQASNGDCESTEHGPDDLDPGGHEGTTESTELQSGEMSRNRDGGGPEWVGLCTNVAELRENVNR